MKPSLFFSEQDVAADFFRTLSSHGKRPDPASKAALHRTRVRSAVMTPSRKQRQEQQDSESTFQQLSRYGIIHNHTQSQQLLMLADSLTEKTNLLNLCWKNNKQPMQSARNSLLGDVNFPQNARINVVFGCVIISYSRGTSSGGICYHCLCFCSWNLVHPQINAYHHLYPSPIGGVAS